MKKLALISLSLILSLGLFAQVAKYQPKTIAIFMGEKSPSFDESRFPDIKFYYIPGMKLKESGNKSTTGKAVMSTIGVNMDEEMQEYEGKPEGMIYRRNTILAFDKNGIFAGSGNMGDQHVDKIPIATGKNMGNYEYTNLATLSKEFIKKDKPMKPGKKMKAKKPRVYNYVSFHVPDFDVADADGNVKPFNDLVKGNPMTVVTFVYLDSGFDGQKGTESGADFESTVQTVAFEKQIMPLINLEKDIFGKNVNL